jgi:hypothetical protein
MTVADLSFQTSYILKLINTVGNIQLSIHTTDTLHLPGNSTTGLENLFVPTPKSYFRKKGKKSLSIWFQMHVTVTVFTRVVRVQGLLWSSNKLVRFEVITAVTMQNAVFWDVAPCRYFVNRRF